MSEFNIDEFLLPSPDNVDWPQFMDENTESDPILSAFPPSSQKVASQQPQPPPIKVPYETPLDEPTPAIQYIYNNYEYKFGLLNDPLVRMTDSAIPQYKYNWDPVNPNNFNHPTEYPGLSICVRSLTESYYGPPQVGSANRMVQPPVQPQSRPHPHPQPQPQSVQQSQHSQPPTPHPQAQVVQRAYPQQQQQQQQQPQNQQVQQQQRPPSQPQPQPQPQQQQQFVQYDNSNSNNTNAKQQRQQLQHPVRFNNSNQYGMHNQASTANVPASQARTYYNGYNTDKQPPQQQYYQHQQHQQQAQQPHQQQYSQSPVSR